MICQNCGRVLEKVGEWYRCERCLDKILEKIDSKIKPLEERVRYLNGVRRAAMTGDINFANSELTKLEEESNIILLNMLTQKNLWMYCI